MDFLFNAIDRMIGPDTEIVELLPLLVLAAVLVALRYLRSLILRLFVEIGEVKEHIGLRQMIQDMQRENEAYRNPPDRAGAPSDVNPTLGHPGA